MTWNRVVVAGVAVIVAVAALDAVRSGGAAEPVRTVAEPLRIDLASSEPRDTWNEATRGGVVSKVARHGETTAIAISEVPGGGERPRARIELWRGGERFSSFRVRPGSFSHGLWFTEGGYLAASGWNGRAWLWRQDGSPAPGEAYVEYVTR